MIEINNHHIILDSVTAVGPIIYETTRSSESYYFLVYLTGGVLKLSYGWADSSKKRANDERIQLLRAIGRNQQNYKGCETF